MKELIRQESCQDFLREITTLWACPSPTPSRSRSGDRNDRRTKGSSIAQPGRLLGHVARPALVDISASVYLLEPRLGGELALAGHVSVRRTHPGGTAECSRALRRTERHHWFPE